MNMEIVGAEPSEAGEDMNVVGEIEGGSALVEYNTKNWLDSFDDHELQEALGLVTSNMDSSQNPVESPQGLEEEASIWDLVYNPARDNLLDTEYHHKVG